VVVVVAAVGAVVVKGYEHELYDQYITTTIKSNLHFPPLLYNEKQKTTKQSRKERRKIRRNRESK